MTRRPRYEVRHNFMSDARPWQIILRSSEGDWHPVANFKSEETANKALTSRYVFAADEHGRDPDGCPDWQ